MQGNGQGSEATRYLLIDRGRERERKIAGKIDMEEREEKEEKEDEEEEEEEGEGGDEETDEKGISCV